MEYFLGAMAVWLITIEIRLWLHRRGINGTLQILLELVDNLEYEPNDKENNDGTH